MPDAKDLIERGIRLERGGVVDEALRVFVEAEHAATNPAALSEALRHQADVLRVRCDWELATRQAARAEQVAREAGLFDAAAEALNARAAIAQSRSEFPEAAALYTEALTLSKQPRIRGCALQNLGAIAAMNDAHDRAAEYFEGSLSCFREAGYERGVAIALNNVGRASLDRGDAIRAEEALAIAVSQARQIEDLELASLALVNYAEALLARGELARGEEEVSAALGFFKVSGNTWRQIECLRILGDLRRARGEMDVAGRLYDQALLLAQRIGATREEEEARARLATLAPVIEP
ncbi:MAG TPA: hypothetical protein VF039_11820 [Longimicrobiales bacterium]